MNDIFRNKLNELISSEKLSLDTLQATSKIDKKILKKFLDGENTDFSPDDGTFLADLASFLTDGINIIDDDSRTQGILEMLTQVYKLNDKAIALYIGIEEQTLKDFINNPSNISAEIKYKIAVTTFMIYYLFKFPNYGKIN